MVHTVISVDLNKKVEEQGPNFHNRWHPLIPPVAHVKQNETFRVECFDWTGGQIKNNDSAEDIKNANTTISHIMSGPISVEGAEPGDALEVEILDVQPLPDSQWGYTAILDINNGGGFLCSEFNKAHKAIWDFDGIFASSRHIPGVKFTGLIHPGLIGTAPSEEVLKEWNRREEDLVKREGNHIPALANLPSSNSALVGLLEGTPKGEIVKAEGARTIPPRENGGNCDIKNLSSGSKVWFPVYVPGANLSVGDIHFNQGDGEIAFCGGIEMSGAVTLRVKVIKNGISDLALKNPIFLPGPEPHYNNYLTFQGISVDEKGEQKYLDPKLSFKQACLNAIAYLTKFGYSREQAYLLLSAAPCEGRINSIVDVPNACCSIGIPTQIFNFDVMPKEGGPKSSPKAPCASAKY